MTLYSFIGTTSGLIILIWTFVLVKQDKLMLKFALPWISLALFSIVFSISESFASWLTTLIGFEKPSNVYLTVTVGSLIALGIMLSTEVTKSVKRLERAASAIALMGSNINKDSK